MLTGRCACGAVRFELIGAPVDAGYCHCHRCQHRTGTAASLVALVPRADFTVVAGEDAIRWWEPDGGKAKAFCVHCGGHLFSGRLDGDAPLAVRFGAFDADPGIRPRWRQWVGSAVSWEAIPDDGLPRHAGGRPG